MGKAVLANLQNGRGGAGTAFFNAFDPEIKTLLQLRNVRNTEDKKIRDLHYAMLTNPWFAKKVAENGKIFLFNPYTAPDLTKLFYSADLKGFVDLYLKYEADESFKKTYVSAREILYTSFSEAYETGTAYIGNIHEMNRHTPFKEAIHSSNLCVAPESLLLTNKGEFEIHTLVNKQVRVWNGVQWSDTVVKKTGENQKLLTVVTNLGGLDCTEYHKWYVMREGTEVEIRTHELVAGDVLSDWYLPEGGTESTIVQDIVDDGRVADTYCVTEPIRNRAVFNGILTGNCMEISEPTLPYYDMEDLYSSEDHGRGEIATCNLAAVIKENIESDEEYGEVMYYALKMIDYCILNSKYVFPHLALTAKARMNAGVGIMGYAVHMARKGLLFSSPEGKLESHRSAETHMYHAIRASLRISKERGVAPWIHKTKWPEGWLPIDTYNKGVDTIADFTCERDWEALRKEIIDNGGIGHSVLIAHMPGEASSKAAGTSNGLYPVRELNLVKTDNGITTRWAAPYGDDPSYVYESAWDVGSINMIDHYAIWQKFTDQAISADLWRRIPADETITTEEIRSEFLQMVRKGLKTRYYQNTQTAEAPDMEGNVRISEMIPEQDGEACDTCTL